MDKDEDAAGLERRPHLRLRPERRDKFLEVLGQTGNRRFAAESIGVEPRLMDQRRRYDKVLDRQWTAALGQADRRLAGAAGPFDCIGARELNVIKRGRDGRLQLVAAGPKRWSRTVEERFLATLAMCGNTAASARAIGFSESSVWERRRRWSDFARAMEAALDDAEVRIEFRLAAIGNDVGVGIDGEEKEAVAGDCPAAIPFDPEFALRFLKWREEKRRRGGRSGRLPSPPPIDEVRQRIVRRVQAIKRHRAENRDAPE